jgi:acyl-[acyl-carrier-protein]-phospholipid O-acyltransferase/long-chain-fatty-acid--[acyl-carrier-protein] ligase
LAASARAQGIGELNVPKRVFYAKTMPLLGSGKIDYPGVTALIEQLLPAAEQEVL